MRESPPTAVLTAASPVFAFNGSPGTVKYLATSGEHDGGTPIWAHRVSEADTWVVRDDVVPSATSGDLQQTVTLLAVFNKIELLTGGANAAVNLSL